MSRRNRSRLSPAGFTLVELLVSMTVASVLALSAYQFFNVSLSQYFGLQQNSVASGELAVNAQRIANVLRGLTDIMSSGANDMTMYAYFSPNDTYVSQVRYYLNATNTQLLADITPMTANPPIGTPITAQKRTYIVIDDYLKVNNLDLFTYLDSTGAALSQPIATINSIKGIKVNLAVPHNDPVAGASQQMSLQVTLRNKKTNL